MDKFTYGNYSYEYKVLRQDRKTISLTVKPDMGIVLKCPKNADTDRIEKFLKRKWSWMNKQLKFFERFQIKKYKREYVSGESFLYLGRQYKLVIKRSKKDSVGLYNGILQINTTKPVRDSKYTKGLIDLWLNERIDDIFFERFLEMQKRFDYKNMPKLKIRNMAKRWGSFLNKDYILLNPKLIHASKDCIDYVIVHELCHMRYKNHGKNFWDFLDKKYPKWEKIKEKLELRYAVYY